MTLKEHLFQHYGSPDKRIKNIDKVKFFIVDDRNGPGAKPPFDSKGELFYWFCRVHATVAGNDSVEVELSGGLPTNEATKHWAASNGASLATQGSHGSMRFKVTLGDEDKLDALADVFADIVRRGKDHEKWYYFTCPRTATNLRALADALRSYEHG